MITLIAAISQNNCIGKDGKLPWHLPADMKHFKDLTMGHTVIMGRKTWESIPEKFRPLPGRTNVVVTRQLNYALPEGVEHAASVTEALTGHSGEDVYVIGGAMAYAEALPKADRLEITHIEQTVEGDAFFPEINLADWKEINRESHEGFAFVTYERIR